MPTASSNLWALIANDPTHPAVRALCEAVTAILDLSEWAGVPGGGDAAFPGGAAGLEVGKRWPQLYPALRAAATRLGWRSIIG